MNRVSASTFFSRKSLSRFAPIFGKTSFAFNFTALLTFAAIISSATINAYAVCQTPQFGLPIVLNVTRPVAAASGDFDRNGTIDIAVLKIVSGGSFAGVVEIFSGNGNGGFTSTGVQYNAIPLGGGQVFVNDLVAADFNNDGRLDLFAAGNFASSSVLLGNPTGGFSSPTSLSLPDLLAFIKVADFNNDGNPDVIGKSFGDRVMVLPGLGNGNFGGAVTVLTASGGSSPVVKDFNNDGFLDFAVANSSSTAQSVSVRLGNGNFVFTNAPTVNIQRALETVADDFNRDGKQDFVAIDYNSDGLTSVNLGIGDGTFSSPVGSPFLVGGSLQFITSGDFNSDNILDIAVTNAGTSNSLKVLLNNGSGIFGSPNNLSPEQGGSEKLYSVDFNQNGATDLVIVKEEAQNKVVVLPNLCPPASRNNFPDFDADGRADLSVFRPSNGTWYVNRSTQGNTQNQFGIATDKLIPADYDGDGRTDVAVYRVADGIWYIFNSTTNTVRALLYGFPTDIPLPGDYDGDGKADLAVFRPSSGTWFLLGSANNNFTITQFGLNGDIPILGNFDTDTKTDIAVFRPSNGTWYILRSALGFTATQWGSSGDTPVAADYDGDGRTDFGVFRNGTWFLLRSTLGFQSFGWGTTGDTPTPADYDGDGRSDFAVFRNGTWFLSRSTAGVQVTGFGVAGDKPIPASFQP